MNSQKSHLPFRVPKAVWACAVVTLACVACHKDDDVAPAAVVGHWKGTQALIQVQLDGTALPYEVTDDDFNPEIEFKSDGTVRMEQDGDAYNGNYSSRETRSRWHRYACARALSICLERTPFRKPTTPCWYCIPKKPT